jgi:hypothetical protein
MPRVVVLWLCMAAVLGAAKIKSKAESDPKFDFRTVRTWDWDLQNTGDVMTARSAEDDPAVVKKRVDPFVVAAVDSEMGRRGLTSAPGRADIRMHYYLLITVGAATQTMGQFLPPLPAWGLPPFAPATTALNIVQRGALVLDAFAKSADRVVWRGVAESDIDQLKSDEERQERIRDSVRDLIKRLPIKS